MRWWANGRSAGLPKHKTTPYYDNGVVQLYQTDARDLPLPDQSVHCVVTSPPYFGLRVYQDNDERGIGLEDSVEEYVDMLVQVFREVRRVLRDDGVLWLNMGDSYSDDSKWGGTTGGKHVSGLHGQTGVGRRKTSHGLAGGNRLGIPEHLVLALQADGWVWRDDVTWFKRAPMPESVDGTRWERCKVKVAKGEQIDDAFDHPGREHRDVGSFNDNDGQAQWSDCPGCAKCEVNDGLVLREGSWRTTQASEHIYMLTKGMGYYCDSEAVKQVSESGASDTKKMAEAATRIGGKNKHLIDGKSKASAATNIGRLRAVGKPGYRNRRSVWDDVKPEKYDSMVCPVCHRNFKSRVYERFPKVEDHPICPRCEAPLHGHFATFPSDLPRICIQVTTSEVGVCPDCGSQWARVVEKAKVGDHTPDKNLVTGRTLNSMGGQQEWDKHQGTKTLGWRPTCSCDAGEPVPATVLDPFAGTATTCLAAQRLGRHAVGVDLSPTYLTQGVVRLSEVPLPLGAGR